MYNNICINFFKLDQKIYILDNLNNNIISFDENGQFLELKPLRDVSSNYIDLSNYVEFSWQKIIIIDSLASKLYLPMKNKNFTTLFELNPNTGILSKSLTLPHILVKKIRLHGDEVYYLYEKPGSLNEWALYKTRILWFLKYKLVSENKKIRLNRISGNMFSLIFLFQKPRYNLLKGISTGRSWTVLWPK